MTRWSSRMSASFSVSVTRVSMSVTFSSIVRVFVSFVGRPLKIGTHPVLEISRLPDIEDGPLCIFEKVDPGMGG